MNLCIVEIFEDPKKSEKLTRGLPKAFEMASLELPSGNPAVGFLREHAITGFFLHLIGKDKIKIPSSGNKKGFDISVCGEPLSIKTVTANGGVKVVWTVDDDSVKKEIGGIYKPDCDMLLTKIYWGKECPSIFYIPLSVQRDIYDKLGSKEYLTAASGTNHRGISIRQPAMKKLLEHPSTLSMVVNWQMVGLDYTPYSRWEEFWEEV